jgi:hypothetical protein
LCWRTLVSGEQVRENAHGTKYQQNEKHPFHGTSNNRLVANPLNDMLLVMGTIPS